MFAMKRLEAAAKDTADVGRDAYDDTTSRLNVANRQLVRLVERARDADLPSQRRVLSTVEEAIGTLSDRGERTWKAMADVGQDQVDRVGKFGYDGLERLGLVRRRTWWERMGLPSFSRSAVPSLPKMDGKKIGSALAEAPVLGGVMKTDYRRAGKRALDRIDLPTADWEMPAVSFRLGRQRQGWPVRNLLIGASVAAGAWYLLGSKSRRTWLLDTISGRAAEPKHADHALHHPPVVDGAYSLRGDSTPTDGRSTGSEHAQTLSAESLRKRSASGPSHPGGSGAPIGGLPSSVFMPSAAPGASAEMQPRTVDATRVNGGSQSATARSEQAAPDAEHGSHHPEHEHDRSDADVLEAVEVALLAEPVTQAAAASTVQVTAHHGKVTLRGNVPNPMVKRVAEERAAAVEGVTTVVNELLLGQHV